MTAEGFLAVWGAVTATFAVGWNLVRDLKDSGKLRIDAMIGKKHPDPSGQRHLVITVTNVGRRPVLVKGLLTLQKQPWYQSFFRYRVVTYRSMAPNGLLLLRNGPKMLKEGEFLTEVFQDFSFIDGRLAAIAAVDSGGREWRLKGKRLRYLINDALNKREEAG